MLICLMGGSRETPAERRIYSLKRECVQRPRPANGEETSGGSSRSNQQIANAGTMGAIWGKSAKALVQRNGTSADGRQNVLVKRVGKRGDQKLRQTIGIEAGLPFPAADTPVPQLVGGGDGNRLRKGVDDVRIARRTHRKDTVAVIRAARGGHVGGSGGSRKNRRHDNPEDCKQKFQTGNKFLSLRQIVKQLLCGARKTGNKKMPRKKFTNFVDLDKTDVLR